MGTESSMNNIISIKQQAAENFAAQFPMLAQRGIDEPTWNALCNTIYPGANPDSVVMAIDYCKARGFDVMLKPVHLVPMQVTDARTKEKIWRDVPMPGIGMYRIQADRSGNYAGADEPEFGPDVTEEFRYHVQNAMYCDGYEQTFGERPEFLFLAVSSSIECGRYPVRVRPLEPDWIAAGSELYRRDLNTFHQCRINNDWHDFKPAIRPAWARRAA